MTALSFLVSMLGGGATVVWGGPLPGIRVPRPFRQAIAQLTATDNDHITECLRRAGAFRQQIKAAEGGPALPLLVVYHSAPKLGEVGDCLSCGAVLSAGEAWRCLMCVVAVHIALDDVEALLTRMELA